MTKLREKQLAISLRTNGCSLNEISKEVDVSKSIVSLWVRDIILSEESIERLKQKIKTNQMKFIEKYRHPKKIIHKPILSKILKCRVCGIELDNINWSLYKKNKNQHICKHCHVVENKKYVVNNSEKVRLHQKEYYNKIREKKRIYKKVWDENHPNYMEEYFKTPNGKIAIRKQTHKRRRELGCNPLNSYFSGCVSHHVDTKNIIFIPEKLNKSIPHNVYTGHNMDIINTHAYFFLMMQNIDTLKKLFG